MVGENPRRWLVVTTHARLGSSIHDGARSKPSGRAARRAAVAAAVGFFGLALFQLALAVGFEWGHAAWGGANAELSSTQRIGSAVAVLVWTAAALVVLGRAGILWSSRPLARIYRWGTWVAAIACALGSFPNLASQSRYENLILGPLGVVLAILCFVVARSRPSFER
jgi:hypothetical protein